MSEASPTSPSPSTEPSTETAPSEPTSEQQAPPEQPAEVMPDATPDDLRAEVRRLRDEAGEHRVKGRRADALATRLVEAYAAATGLLADPSDLRFDPALLDDDGLPDPAKVRAAVDGLLASKPHLASRTPRGDVDQGARDDAADISLTGLLRAGA